MGIHLVVALVLASTLQVSILPLRDRRSPYPLFNGTDLGGWVVPEGKSKQFVVRDGPARRSPFGWPVHIAANRLQVELLVTNRGDIPHDIHNRGGEPAEIIQLVKFDIEPVTVDVTPSNRYLVTCVQVRSMQVGGGWTIPAVRLLVDGHGGKGKTSL